jgi:NAD(P)H-dependent FMN reductase
MSARLRAKGVEATVLDLYELPLPLYSPDADSRDANTRHLVGVVAQADGVVLATPEYHGSISGVLKNALDYMSASEFDGKPVLSVSSSGGPVGVSSLTQLQAIVRNLHGINSPEWISIGGDTRQFGADSAPLDSGLRQRTERALDLLLDLASLLKPVKAL